MCLRWLADGDAPAAEPRRKKLRGRGRELEAAKAIRAYEKGGDDVWSVILAYAF
jgi:hypothetical protein